MPAQTADTKRIESAQGADQVLGVRKAVDGVVAAPVQQRVAATDTPEWTDGGRREEARRVGDEVGCIVEQRASTVAMPEGDGNERRIRNHRNGDERRIRNEPRIRNR